MEERHSSGAGLGAVSGKLEMTLDLRQMMLNRDDYV